MYNNEVTYDKKWDTPENRKALETLEKKYFDKSVCYPSCPVAWAPEVLELLETVDKELGLQYNESTMRSYYIQGKPFDHFITGPFKGAWQAFHSNFLKTVDPESERQVKNRALPVFTRLKKVVDGGLHSIRYGIRAFKISHINPILNKTFKPKVSLSQIKEKYGRMEFYYAAPDCYEQYIDGLISRCKVKLAVKGCYYPIESLYSSACSWSCGTKYRAEEYTVTKDEDGTSTVSITSHRQAMVDLGLNLEEIKIKYEQYIAAQAASNF